MDSMMFVFLSDFRNSGGRPNLVTARTRKIDRDGKSGEGGGGLREMKHDHDNHLLIDRKWHPVRCLGPTGTVRHDGHELENLLDMDNGRETVRAGSAQLSAEKKGFRSRIRRKKPRGKPMPKCVGGANAKRSRMRACVERAFAGRKGPMEFSIDGVHPSRAEGWIGMANLCYDMRHLI